VASGVRTDRGTGSEFCGVPEPKTPVAPLAASRSVVVNVNLVPFPDVTVDGVNTTVTPIGSRVELNVTGLLKAPTAVVVIAKDAECSAATVLGCCRRHQDESRHYLQPGYGIKKELLQLCALSFGLYKDRDVGIGTVP
jgi:hypothetical protein